MTVQESIIALANAMITDMQENCFDPQNMSDIYTAIDSYQIEDEVASLIAQSYTINHTKGQ